jgi:hypothetical protein
VLACAQEDGLIGAKPEAAIDATGLESRHTSAYFVRRQGKRPRSRQYIKLAAAQNRGGARVGSLPFA